MWCSCQTLAKVSAMGMKYQLKGYQLSSFADLSVITCKPTWFWKNSISYQRFDCTQLPMSLLPSASEETPPVDTWPLFTKSHLTSLPSSSPPHDSSDDYSLDVLISQIPVKMPENKNMIAIHLILSQPPHLLTGKIMPSVLCDFKNLAENFFMNAKNGVSDIEKVAKILGCFESSLVNNWISFNCE
jgi:hypothetical protein